MDTTADIMEKIKNIPKNIRIGQQNKHILGTHEYRQYSELLNSKGEYGPSYITGDLYFAKSLLDMYAGTGEFVIKNGKWLNIEKVLSSNTIGTVVNNLTGKEAQTCKFKIHYSVEGAHIVPDYMSK